MEYLEWTKEVEKKTSEQEQFEQELYITVTFPPMSTGRTLGEVHVVLLTIQQN